MDKIKTISIKQISKLPKTPGVYIFYAKRDLLYIGKATDIKIRVKDHFQQPSYRDNLFIDKVNKIGYIKTFSEIEALLLEAELIKKYNPKYNITWKDDKNYFYAGITKEEFPKVFITHQIKINLLKTKSEYTGPFVDGKSLRETLKSLRKVFPFRSCNFLPKKPCLWYQLDRCSAPCLTRSKTAQQIPTLKSTIKKEIQRNTKNLLKVLQGKKKQVLTNLKKEMRNLSKQQKFEKAERIKKQIYALEKVLLHSHIIENEKEEIWELENTLKKIFKTKKEVERMEAYDISNIQGKEATGSMVTFIKGKPNKSFYRKFKIRREAKPDDVAMLKEVLERRLKHKDWPLADLILIDGGKPQLNAAKEIIKNKTKVISLAKKNEEIYVEGRKNPILAKILPRDVFNLILSMRDEAHRFAIAYHKKLRQKSLLGF
ncbi:MAG: GIY-YIG nuclease family protein [bacterium]